MSAVQVAIGLMVTFLVLFAALFGYFIAVGVNQTNQRFQERSSAAAQVVAADVFWIVEVANQTLRRVDTALGPAMSGNPQDLKPALDGLPAVVDVYIIDAEANTIYATVPGADAVSVSDRDYFTALRDGAEFYTSPMIVSRLTGDRIFVFSKRVERNGAFAGAIMVSYSDSMLENIWKTLDLGDGSTISLVRDDGQLMARYPPAEEAVDLSALPLFTQYLPASPEGSYASDRSPVDGVARVVSYRAVEGTSIIALASVATDEAWQAFVRNILIVLLIVSPVIVGLALGSWWIVVLLNRDTRHTEQLTTLFREIHHRVKNNMASVQALVRMQNIPDEAKRDLQSRFAAMAALHEHIYRHDGYASVSARELVPAMVEQVNAAYGSTAAIEYDIADVEIGHDQATPMALLLSELVTNALKYAFPNGRRGTISIVLSPADPSGRSKLIVRDDGVGMPDTDARSSMGMRLVKGVVAQLQGDFQFRNDRGAVFEASVVLSDRT
ncbi:MAG TPA: cache domain-containing protein [Devosia sp.]|uniref:sensor histidine kinase n=1 Tax=Devosia sp. TaxID=1871048 RepID=UPI002DDD487A|nr:cache domain-containing protein [Devosia sp.]HEV2518073.1 cache domain-containing protein [Devosia sp.]